jgi:transcriptional regulator with XRE-family HTH domain
MGVVAQCNNLCNNSFMAYLRTEQIGAGKLLTIDGASLTSVRVSAQVSMEELAGKLECNKAQISRWEQGQFIPSQERIFKMIELFGTSNFVRLNDKAEITAHERSVVRGLRDELVVERLNGKAVLTAEEIEVVRKLREG